MKIPQGFQFSGVAAGLKPQRKDVALIYSATPCNVAGVLTVNAAKAAPVLDAAKRLPATGIHALVINSGNANALTGAAGLQAVQDIHQAVAQALSVSPAAVLSASTGVIGVRFASEKVVAAAPQLVAGLRIEADTAAEAILTTDTRVKMASRTVLLGNRPVTLAAIAKGSGMIAPQLATVIAAIVTDASISCAALDAALREATRTSFNRLTIDNDMSTNDSVFVLANGQAGGPQLGVDSEELESFTAALSNLCQELAREVAADGEGSTKRIEVVVTRAPELHVAEDLAKAVAGSTLVKAAIFGADPNWGRVLATVGARIGSQGFAVDPFRARVRIQGITVYDAAPIDWDRTLLKRRMREPEIRVEVELDEGSNTATAWGCDLSYDYVKINADYTSLIIERPEGGIGRDDRFTNYSPAFKVSLLVQALGYISRFKGQRCVISVGGEALAKESLKRAFCEDVLLLHSVGLNPIVVHGGGPDVARTLARLGTVPEFVDGQRVTDPSDLKLVEMVLTGSINSDLITLLNRTGGNAVGLSGKDGALLRAQKRVRADGKDLGQAGELTFVNASLLEMMMQQHYIPVISPVGIGMDGQSYNLTAEEVAAGVAAAMKASKLIFVADVPGVFDGAELLSELTPAQLQARLSAGAISNGMADRALAILKAMGGGVKAAHVIDGRTPHTVIAELFTDRGVGTLVSAEGE